MVYHSWLTETVTVDQRASLALETWQPLGTFLFAEGNAGYLSFAIEWKGGFGTVCHYSLPI
jgi:hypothetical protein